MMARFAEMQNSTGFKMISIAGSALMSQATPALMIFAASGVGSLVSSKVIGPVVSKVRSLLRKDSEALLIAKAILEIRAGQNKAKHEMTEALAGQEIAKLEKEGKTLSDQEKAGITQKIVRSVNAQSEDVTATYKVVEMVQERHVKDATPEQILGVLTLGMSRNAISNVQTHYKEAVGLDNAFAQMIPIATLAKDDFNVRNAFTGYQASLVEDHLQNVTENPEEWASHFELAKSKAVLGEYKDAINSLYHIITFNEGKAKQEAPVLYWHSHLMLGQIAQKQDRIQDAE